MADEKNTPEKPQSHPLYCRQCTQCFAFHAYQPVCPSCHHKYKTMIEGYQSNYAPTNDDLYVENPFEPQPPDDGLNLRQAAFLVSKCLLYTGAISIPSWDEDDLFENDERLTEKLTQYTKQYVDLLLSGIEGGELKPVYIRKDASGKIIPEKTYVDEHDMDSFLLSRSINLGDYFHFEYSYIKHHISDIASSAQAAERARMDLEKKSRVCIDFSNKDEVIARLKKENESLSEENSKKRKENDAVTYTTPFLELMLAAIADLNISKTNQLKKEEIVTWFLNQKIDGVKVSKNMAESMASFIRLSESRLGGNKSFK
jgi:hypothetical protein